MDNYVTVHALSAGHLTLPERFFVAPIDNPDARSTVPSLSFLIQHRDATTDSVTRIVFDLGIRRDIACYSAPIREHALTRQPISGTPDVVSSLSMGGLTPDDIQYVILSHVHWDHVGMPFDFGKTRFVVGNGVISLLGGTGQSNEASHNHFEADLLPPDRVIELSSPASPKSEKTSISPSERGELSFDRLWQAIGVIPHALDIFGDGSVYIVWAPGHLQGHINLLCQIGNRKYVYLAGDACHDSRLLSKEKEIATWADDKYPNRLFCIHSDKTAAEDTLDMIRKLSSGHSGIGEVEVVFAHDAKWEHNAKRAARFFPGKL